MNSDALIYIAGHRGMVGSAILRKLRSEGHSKFVLRDSSDLDLRDQHAVKSFFQREHPDYVFLAAAQACHIDATKAERAEFIYNNIMIEANIIHCAYETGVKKLLFLASSCVYPETAPQPMDESQLLRGPLDYSNEPYAIAKIAGIKMCQAYSSQYGCNFVSLLPTNVYGPNEKEELERSYLLPSMLRNIYEAKLRNLPSAELWGPASGRREFLHVDDLADACVFLMDTYDSPEIINVGVGQDVQLSELAQLIRDILSYRGRLIFKSRDTQGPGCLNVNKINSLGWRARIRLQDGIRALVKEYARRHPL